MYPVCPLGGRHSATTGHTVTMTPVSVLSLLSACRARGRDRANAHCANHGSHLGWTCGKSPRCDPDGPSDRTSVPGDPVTAKNP